MLQQLSLTKCRILAALLAAAGLAYAALLVTTYLQVTPPSNVAPDLADLDRLLFPAEKPISPMQRRLEAADTPLGMGPLITGRTPSQLAELTKLATTTDLAYREGERLALLDWIRSGASRTAYEHDDYALAHFASASSITPEFLVHEVIATNASAAPHVRIRSLINERCLSCHNDDGDDTARLIPFDTYDSIARYLIPDDHTSRPRAWLLAALFSLVPLAILACPAFAFTSHARTTRKKLLVLTLAALAIVSAAWLLSSLLILLTAFFAALICVMVQILATITESLSIHGGRESFSESVLYYGHS